MSWGIAAMISEPDPLVLAWAAHNIELGASELLVYLDGNHPEVERHLSSLPQITLTRIDPPHWPFPDPRPPALGPRQRLLLKDACARTTVDWLFHTDADEFLALPDISARLEAMPPEVDFVYAQMAERMHITAPDPNDIFDGVFRKITPKGLEEDIARIDGPAAPYLEEGVAGYPSGKSIVRMGREITMMVHMPANAGRLKRADLPGAPLLHFDGLTPKSWIRKKQRLLAQQPGAIYATRLGWRAQYRAVNGAKRGNAQLLPLYATIKCASEERLTALDRLGLITRHKLDHSGAVKRVFGVELRKDQAHFDSYPVQCTRMSIPSRWAQLLRGAKRRLVARLAAKRPG